MKYKNIILKTIFISLIGLLVINLIHTFGVSELMARPGGGHSYSGGGGRSRGSYGGGSSGGDGGAIIILIQLLLQLPPQISIPLIGILIFVYLLRQKNIKKGNLTISSGTTLNINRLNTNSIQNQIQSLKASDPNFSEIIFIDFISALYNKFYSYLGKPQFKNIAPFISRNEIQRIKEETDNQNITEIVIGNIQINNISRKNDYNFITVEINANYTNSNNNKKKRIITTEKWILTRKENVVSPKPETMRSLSCPSCGASNDFSDSGTCNFCGTVVAKSQKQWVLTKRIILSKKLFNTSGLAYYAPEEGNSLPTIYQDNINSNIQNLAQELGYQASEWHKSFMQNVAFTYFMKIYNAWNINSIERIRNLITDRTYDNFKFWIDNYQKEGLQNKLDDIAVKNIEIVKINNDKYYNSITLRIYASAKDYVINSKGKVVGGSAKKPRHFSEYWTFIRTRNAKQTQFSHNQCPNCGADADKIGQAGICQYCNSKISTGNFSWVLANITQDEEYIG